MMKKASLLFALCMLSAGLVRAQDENAGKSFTLEQAIDYALKNSYNVKNAGIDEQLANAQIGEVRAIGLPQVDGAVQLVHNTQLPRFFTRVDTAGGFPPMSDEDKENSAPFQGNTIAAKNFFQLRNSGDASLSISQLIFNGSYIVGLKAAKTYKELSTKASTRTRIQTVEGVTKAFYAVLINNERIKLFDANIARVDSLLKNTTALNQNGFAENIDVDRIKVTLNNLKSEKAKFINIQDLALELLKFQLNYPMKDELAIVGSIDNIKLDSSSIQAASQDLNYSNRIEYSMMETQMQLQKLNVKNTYVAYLPTISAFGNLGYQTQSPTFGGLFKTETQGFPETEVAGPDKWYHYGLVGLSLSVPIFDGLQKHYLMQKAKLEQQKVENSSFQLKSAIDLEVSQANIFLRNSIQTLTSQKENVTLASNVARVTKIKYNEGVGSNLEVTEAETALTDAQNNYYNAFFDAMVAQVDLQIALGTFVK